MDFDDYQVGAVTTAIYPTDSTNMKLGLIYVALKLAGEAGEFAQKIGKCIRDDEGIINDELRYELISELGDIQWYIANAARELDVSLSIVAHRNLDKLGRRSAEGRLRGSGDFR